MKKEKVCSPVRSPGPIIRDERKLSTTRQRHVSEGSSSGLELDEDVKPSPVELILAEATYIRARDERASPAKWKTVLKKRRFDPECFGPKKPAQVCRSMP